ncbi:MAG: CxxxxCH/CxxCH domain c-type cytochrome [Desulfobulbaceae bacterium]
MRSNNSSFWKICILTAATTLLAVSAQAMDAPHNISTGTGCLSCHSMTSTEPNLIPTDTYIPDPGDIDYTLNNSVCWKCHNEGPYGTAPYMPTHSSQQTDTSYGAWTVECWVCHNQHSQDQFKGYGSASYEFTGTIAPGGVTATTIQVTGAAWTVDQWAGYIVVPNTIRLNYNYKIVGNTADTLTVEGAINQTYAAAGNSLGISYGKFIRATINLANIGKPAASKAVRFFRPTGPNSFADGDPAKIDGICEVCHTLTSHWRNDGSFAAVGVHDGLQATNCMSCHPHSEGFKADCGACHGFPPEDGATLVSSPGPTGSATAGAHIEHTTNQAIGCDACHYKNIPDGEHNNGTPLSVTIGFGPNAPIPQGGSYDGQALVPYDRTTTVPETTVSSGGSKTCATLYCHGNYAGSGLNASPVWDVPATGDCGTCHGASNTAWPADAAPAGTHFWHASTAASGGYDMSCLTCHDNVAAGTGPTSYTIADTALHVDGTVDWQFNSSDPRMSGSSAYSVASGTEPPTDGTVRAYGTCSSVYCHSNAQPNGGVGAPAYQTPQWATNITCGNLAAGACHAVDQGHWLSGPEISTGSHPKHLTYPYNDSSNARKCTLCHKWNLAAPAHSGCTACHDTADARTQRNIYHVNKQVDLRFETAFTGATATYNGTPAPGDGYGSCASMYCHSQGTTTDAASFVAPNDTAVWGIEFSDTTNTAKSCASCHGAARGWDNVVATNGHTAHVNNESVADYPATDNPWQRGCNTCHSATTTTNDSISSTTNHVNRLANIKFEDVLNRNTDNTTGPTYNGLASTGANGAAVTPDGTGSNCSNLYCHSVGNLDQNIDANNDDIGEGNVVPVSLGAVTKDFLTILWENPTTQLDCDGCHGTFVSDNAYYPDYQSGAAGSTTANSHESHVKDAGKHCKYCHVTTTPDNSTTPSFFLSNGAHLNRMEDVAFWPLDNWETPSPALPVSIPEPTPYNNSSKQCANAYCHSDGTAVSTGALANADTVTWGDNTLTCGSCHGGTTTGPNYGNGTPKANSHDEHIAAGYTCKDCHYGTTEDNATIIAGDGSMHANGTYDLQAGPGISFTYTFNSAGGTCSSVSCHGGTFTATWGHTHDVSYNAAVDLSQVSMAGDNPCGNCHNGNNDDGDNTPLNSWADILSEHETGCVRCHEYTDDGNGTPTETEVTNAITSGTNVTCVTCHVKKDKAVDIANGTTNSDHGYLPHDDAPNRTVVTWTSASGAGTDPDCLVCHDDGGTEVVYSSTTHGGDCALCHVGIPNPLQDPTALTLAMPNPDLITTNDGGGSCVACHTASYSLHAVNNPNRATALHNNVSLTYAATNGCESCHGSLDTWGEIAVLHTGCSACHSSDVPDVVATIQSGRSNLNGFTGGNTVVDCDDCHITDTDVGVNFNVDDAVTPMGHGQIAATVRGEHNMFSTSGITGVTDCANCHDMGATDVVANFQKRIELHTSPVSGAANSCLTCHVGQGDPANAQIASGIGGTAVNCNGCHTAKSVYTLHGLTEATAADVHDKFYDSTSTAEKYCGNCHTTTTAENRLDLHVNCLYCHDPGNTTYVSPTPITNGTLAPTVVFNGRSTGGNTIQTCENCHAAKDNYSMHGLTDGDGADGVADVHDKLTDSTGVTPTFTNPKILLEATQYSCYQCHDIDQGSENAAAWAKRIQAHTSSNGSGSGTCLTCHNGIAAFETVIHNGREPGHHVGGGSAIPQDCEACHNATINGGGAANSPSGLAMNQYDGSRHHDTKHAQAGDCTWCHADPRPASVDLDPGWADTAYGPDADYGTGWMNASDYNLTGFTLQKQFACRLCHTNYDTTDLQGTTRSTTGLIVYKNTYVPTRYTATNSQNWGVNGDAATTQTAMASHTISKSGSKIQVENFGACLSCHSVQVWHAKPTWNKGTDSCNAPGSTTNGVDDECDNDDNLFDALRQAPGRTYYNNATTPNTNGSDTNAQKLKFNIFATGTNTGGVAMVRMYQRYFFTSSGKPYDSTESEARGKDLYKDYRDNNSNPWISNIPAAANTSRTIIPDHNTVTDGEGMMTSNPQVPYFTNVPTLPVIDEITITSTVWDGSILTVNWSSSLTGRAYTLSESTGTCTGFTVTGTGPYSATCNTGFAYPGTGVVTVTVISDAAGGGSKTASVVDTSGL